MITAIHISVTRRAARMLVVVTLEQHTFTKRIAGLRDHRQVSDTQSPTGLQGHPEQRQRRSQSLLLLQHRDRCGSERRQLQIALL